MPKEHQIIDKGKVSETTHHHVHYVIQPINENVRRYDGAYGQGNHGPVGGAAMHATERVPGETRVFG